MQEGSLGRQEHGGFRPAEPLQPLGGLGSSLPLSGPQRPQSPSAGVFSRSVTQRKQVQSVGHLLASTLAQALSVQGAGDPEKRGPGPEAGEWQTPLPQGPDIRDLRPEGVPAKG